MHAQKDFMAINGFDGHSCWKNRAKRKLKTTGQDIWLSEFHWMAILPEFCCTFATDKLCHMYKTKQGSMHATSYEIL